MRNLLSAAALLFVVNSCYTPPSNCADFKVGTFQYQAYTKGELIQAKIVRNDSLEIDYYDPKHPDTSQIRWINDCEYVLKKYQPKSAGEKRSFSMRITETEGNTYKFVFKEVGSHQVKEFSATRIEE